MKELKKSLPNPYYGPCALFILEQKCVTGIFLGMGGKGRAAGKASNLSATCEPIVYKMWEPRYLSPMGLNCPLQGYLYLHIEARKFLTLYQQQRTVAYNIG
jgi:hypothetical protein